MKNFSNAVVIILTGIMFSSCLKKNFDTPPDQSGLDPNLPVNKTIAQLNALGTSNVLISDSIIIYGIVTADDRSGNFYKQIEIQDSTGGIAILLDQNSLYGDYPIGRKIYVKCKGLYLGNYHGLPQLGDTPDNTGALSAIPSALIGDYVVKANYPNDVLPQDVLITQISSVNTSLLNCLVKIDAAEFAIGSAGAPYAEPSSVASGTSLTIEDCYGNNIVLRTSGYAYFQPFPTSKGKGSITAIYTTYGSTPQLIIRDTSDVQFYGARCSGSIVPILLKDFEDNSVTSGGWINKNVSGNINWTTNSIGATSGSYYGQCSNYSAGTNTPCETWLISPTVDLSSSTAPVLSFLNGYKYSGAPLAVLVSTNYDGTSDPSTGTWTPLSFTLSSGNFTWANSGPISLSGYKTNNVHIAFKYTGSSSDGSTWEVDDITIKEN